MLRDNTENFAPDFKIVLEQFGISSLSDRGFQLLKFERVGPDVFVWLLRSDRTFLVSISDRAEDLISNKDWLSKWLGGYDTADITQLDDLNDDTIIDDGFDKISVYELPDDYDHDEWINV